MGLEGGRRREEKEGEKRFFVDFRWSLFDFRGCYRNYFFVDG